MNPRRIYCDGPYGQLHLQDTGGNGCPLLLCPQAPLSSRQFDRVYSQLNAHGIRAIGIDSPGFGMSDPPEFVPRIQDYAEAIPAALDALDISSAHILGHHTGALIATEFALKHPDRIRSIVMNGPLPLSEAEREKFMTMVDSFERPFTAKPDGSHIMEWWKRRSSFAGADSDWNLMTLYVCEPLVARGPFWYGHHAAFLYDHATAIKRVTHPTLILTNTGDQIYEHAQRTRALRPDFAYAEIAGGGIDIVDEKPAEWVAEVAKFVIQQDSS